VQFVVIMRLKNEIFVSVLDWLVKNKWIDGQKGLAEATGISTNTISRIVTGKVQPSDSTLRVISEKFGINMEYLRGRDAEHMLIEDLINDTNHQESPNTHESSPVDLDFYHQALKINADVIADLRRNVEYFQQLVLDKDSLIQEHNEQIVALNIDKAKLATELEHLRTTLDAVRNNFDAKVTELEKRDQIIKTLQSVIDRESRGDYRIPTGVAEPPAAYNNDKK
jgi:transcriptional regulator with XRE-family HTH domain